jgi:glycine/D-amino acid oxidase-like deaminating enzyme
MLFDFQTQEWEMLNGPGGGWPNWSKDGRYIFTVGEKTSGRIEIATRKAEVVARFGDIHPVIGVGGVFAWRGMTPDGRPLIAKGKSEEIYALDVDFP